LAHFRWCRRPEVYPGRRRFASLPWRASGGKPQTAIKYPVFAAIFNDAGIGCDRAGISRLPALDAANIAGAPVTG